MNKWVFAALGLVVGVVLGVFVAWYVMPIQLIMSPSYQSEASGVANTTYAEEAVADQAAYEPDWPEFESRWAGAPDDIRELARAIARGETPALNQVAPAALSQGDHAPALDFERDGTPVPYLATLLQEAALASNTGAVQALLDAGADPNVQQYGFRRIIPFKLAESLNNLGATIRLIEAGATPWLKPVEPDGYKISSFMEMLSSTSGNNVAAEVLFRVLRKSQFPSALPQHVQYVLERLDAVVETFAMGTGPDARHTAWRLDQVLTLLGPALDRTAEVERIRAKPTPFDYQADGGWYLAEDEIHSRYDAALFVPDRGDQIWGPS